MFLFLFDLSRWELPLHVHIHIKQSLHPELLNLNGKVLKWLNYIFPSLATSIYFLSSLNPLSICFSFNNLCSIL